MAKDKGKHGGGSGLFQDTTKKGANTPPKGELPPVPPEKTGQVDEVNKADAPDPMAVIEDLGDKRQELKEAQDLAALLQSENGDLNDLLKESGETIAKLNRAIAKLENDIESAPAPDAKNVGRVKPSSDIKQAISKLYTTQGLPACESVFKAAGCNAKNLNEVPKALHEKVLKLALVALDG